MPQKGPPARSRANLMFGVSRKRALFWEVACHVRYISCGSITVSTRCVTPAFAGSGEP